MDSWLASSVKVSVRNSTYTRYEDIVTYHIRPALGRPKLNALTPVQVRELYRAKLASGLSTRNVNYIHVTLHKALKQTVMDGLIPRNETNSVKTPQVHKKEVVPMDHNNLYYRDWKRLLKKARLSETFTFHIIRHTFATLLLQKNANPKIVQEALGHATISQTTDTYSHVVPVMGSVAVDAIDEALV